LTPFRGPRSWQCSRGVGWVKVFELVQGEVVERAFPPGRIAEVRDVVGGGDDEPPVRPSALPAQEFALHRAPSAVASRRPRTPRLAPTEAASSASRTESWPQEPAGVLTAQGPMDLPSSTRRPARRESDAAPRRPRSSVRKSSASTRTSPSVSPSASFRSRPRCRHE
jgi:hypothetical protein